MYIIKIIKKNNYVLKIISIFFMLYVVLGSSVNLNVLFLYQLFGFYVFSKLHIF